MGVRIPKGDYLVEALDYQGNRIAGAMYICATYYDALARAYEMAAAHGVNRWRIMRCIANSSDEDRWDAPIDTEPA